MDSINQDVSTLECQRNELENGRLWKQRVNWDDGPATVWNATAVSNSKYYLLKFAYFPNTHC